MFKITCDKCGKDITGSYLRTAWVVHGGYVAGSKEPEFLQFNFCQECLRKIKSFLVSE